MRKTTHLFLILFLSLTIPCSAQQWKQFRTNNSALFSNDVKSLAQDVHHKIYAGTGNGVTAFTAGTWQTINVAGTPSASILKVWSITDSLWVGTASSGLWRYFNNTWKNYDPNSIGNGIVGFGKNSKDSLYRLDKFGNFSLWTGTAWTHLLTFFSQPNNLFIDRDDNVWLLSNNTGMVQYKNGTFRYWRNTILPSSPDYMPSGSNFDMVQDSTGIYWIASDDGLLRFDGQNFQVFNRQNSGITSTRTRCLEIDNTGKLWIGTWDSGISKYTGTAWITYNLRNSALASPLINDILVDSANNIWIADGSNPYTSPSNGQGIYILDEDADVSNGQLPAAPGSLTGKVISINQVILSWSDLSANESGFVLERSAKDSLHFAQMKYVMDNTTIFTDLTVTDTTYYYRIRSVNNQGYSAYSNTIKVQPRYCVVNETSSGAYAVIKKVSFGNINKETLACVAGYYDYLNLSTSLFAGQTSLLTVSFDRCSTTTDPIIGGVVYIDWNSDGDFTDNGEVVFSNININGKGEYSFPVTVPSNVVPGSVTRMRIRAEDHVYSGPIPSCNTAEVTHDYTLNITAIPAAYNPINGMAKGVTSRKIQLNWQDNAAGETSYTVERSADSLLFSVVVQLPANAIQYTDSLLQPDTRYYYRVIANKAAGSAGSQILSAVTLPADLVRQLRGQVATDMGFNTGAYWGDYNNNGKYDLYTPGNNKLYVNLDTVLNNSNLSFHNSSSAAWADYDNDGDQDIYVPDFLYENNNNGSFTRRSILPADEPVNNCVWTDYNKDGYLDLYISFLYSNAGKLFRNNRDKTFTMVRTFDNARGFASFADYDNDGDDDLIVMGNGQSAVFDLQDSLFTRNTTTSLATYSITTLGYSWTDFDNDGDLDLFVPNSSTSAASYSRLLINLGGGTFTQRVITGLDAAAYGSAWGDYDNDGYQDLFVSRFQKTNKLLRNVNGTLTELPESVYVNEDFSSFPYNEMSSMGCAWADYNRDGFLDLYVAQNNGLASRLYKNGTNPYNWLNILLKGTVSNENAIGALIKIKVNSKWQYRWIQSTSGFGGENSIAAEFGLGTATVIDSLIIRWPSGIIQQLGSIQPNQFLTIAEADPCQVNQWTGNSSNAWENPGNWSCGTVPNRNTAVVISNGAVTVNSNGICRTLTVAPSVTFKLSSGYTLTVTH